MDISQEVDHIPGEESSFCGIVLKVLGQDFMGYAHDVEGTEGVLGVIDDWHNSIIDIGTVFEVKSVEELHVVGVTLDVIWPAGRFDEGTTSVIDQLVDRGDQVSEMD